MAQELDELVARAHAVVLEAKRLIEINWDWQVRTHDTVRRMYLRAIFDPDDRRATYPQDLPQLQRPTYPAFPAKQSSGRSEAD